MMQILKSLSLFILLPIRLNDDKLNIIAIITQAVIKSDYYPKNKYYKYYLKINFNFNSKIKNLKHKLWECNNLFIIVIITIVRHIIFK